MTCRQNRFEQCMSLRWFRPRLPPRLKPNPTPDELRRMARNPSAYAPTAEEVLAPSVSPPTPFHPLPQLRAVLDRPDDDAARLAYADAIEANDPARAELIRCQLKGDPAEELLGEHGPHWAAEFAPWGARDLVYRRGFAEAMSLTGRSFISLGAGLFERTPLREVRLIAVNFLMEELIACEHLAKLEVLNLRGNQIDDEGVEKLLKCPWLGELKRLQLEGNGLTAECEARLRELFGDSLLEFDL